MFIANIFLLDVCIGIFNIYEWKHMVGEKSKYELIGANALIGLPLPNHSIFHQRQIIIMYYGTCEVCYYKCYRSHYQ